MDSGGGEAENREVAVGGHILRSIQGDGFARTHEQVGRSGIADLRPYSRHRSESDSAGLGVLAAGGVIHLEVARACGSDRVDAIIRAADAAAGDLAALRSGARDVVVAVCGPDRSVYLHGCARLQDQASGGGEGNLRIGADRHREDAVVGSGAGRSEGHRESGVALLRLGERGYGRDSEGAGVGCARHRSQPGGVYAGGVGAGECATTFGDVVVGVNGQSAVAAHFQVGRVESDGDDGYGHGTARSVAACGGVGHGEGDIACGGVGVGSHRIVAAVSHYGEAGVHAGGIAASDGVGRVAGVAAHIQGHRSARRHFRLRIGSGESDGGGGADSDGQSGAQSVAARGSVGDHEGGRALRCGRRQGVFARLGGGIGTAYRTERSRVHASGVAAGDGIAVVGFGHIVQGVYHTGAVDAHLQAGGRGIGDGAVGADGYVDRAVYLVAAC